jgi:hypothetical protein
MYRIAPLDPTAPDFHVLSEIDLGNVVRNQQMHGYAKDKDDPYSYTRSHTSTCRKKGTKCRFYFPFKIVAATKIDIDKHIMVMRRNHPFVAVYNKWVALTHSFSNHNVQFLGTGPDAYAVISYTTSYSAKNASETSVMLDTLHKMLSNPYAIASLKEAEEGKARFIRTILKSAFALDGMTAVSGVLAANEACGLPDHYKTHTCCRLNLHAVISRLLNQLEEDNAARVAVLADVNVNAKDGGTEKIPADGSTLADIDGDDAIPVEVDKSNRLYLQLSKRETDQVIARDYIFRGESLDALCLWDFISEWTSMEKPKGAPKTDKVAFLSTHPEAKSKILSRRKFKCVPLLKGFALFPRLDAEPELYSLCVLIMFSPWRSASDLLGEHTTFSEALTMRRPDLGVHCKAVTTNWLEWSRTARDAAVFRFSTSVREQHDAELDAQVQGAGNVTAEANHEELEVADNENDDFLVETEVALSSAALRAEHFATEAGLILQDVVPGGLVHLAAGCEKFSKEVQSAIDSAVARYRFDIVDADGNEQNVDEENDVNGEGEETVKMFALAEMRFPKRIRGQQNLPPFDVTKVIQAVSTVEAGFLLDGKLIRPNHKQKFALRVAMANILCPESFADPLCMVVPGEAGCGKTIFGASLQRVLEQFGLRDALKVMAPTGAAAKLIGGRTIHSSIFATKFKQKDPSLVSAKRSAQLRQAFEKVRFVHIDEMSMVSSTLLVELDQCLRIAKGCNVPFGGLIVFFTGDHFQFPPVSGGCNLTNYNSGPDDETTITKLAAEVVADPAMRKRYNSAIERQGAFLWQTCHTACVILEENMRQGAEQIDFVQLLRRVRSGTATLADEQLLQQNMLRPNDLNTREWLSAPILTPQNDVAVVLGKQRLITLANYTQQQILTWRASDTIRKKKTFRVDIGIDQCGAPAEGFYFAGLPIMVTSNIRATPIVNGMLAFCAGIVLDERENAIDAAQRMFQLIHVPKGGIICTDPNFDRNLSISQLLQLPTCFYVPQSEFKPDQKIAKSLKRIQIPLSPSLAITIHKSQGMSLRHAILDFFSKTTGSRLSSRYVALSRMTTLSGVRLFGSLKPGFLNVGPIPPTYINENARLQRIQAETLQAYQDLVPIQMMPDNEM